MFSWIHKFDLFLFDFDGLLVSTERLHYKAYVAAFKEKGFELDWSFEEFICLAHLSQMAFRLALYEKFPTLDPNWDLLYAEKKRQYAKIIEKGTVDLMPGAEELLYALQKASIRRCVVTHSFRAQVEEIKQQLAPLQTIPLWITREDYENPKPSPDCYLLAIKKLGKAGDRIIGFEDSLRGFLALEASGAAACLICPKEAVPPSLEPRATQFESLKKVFF